MVRDEIIEILDLLDESKVSEENQRKVFSNGLSFNYTYGDPDYRGINKHLNIFGIGMLIKTLKAERRRLSINKIINSPWEFDDHHLLEEIDEFQKNNTRVKILGK